LSRLGLRCRRRILQRVLLEAVALDSDAHRRHAELLRRVTERGGEEAERVAAYERTIEELGLTDRYAELGAAAEYREEGSHSRMKRRSIERKTEEGGESVSRGLSSRTTIAPPASPTPWLLESCFKRFRQSGATEAKW
jgi:hypothetical protein